MRKLAALFLWLTVSALGASLAAAQGPSEQTSIGQASTETPRATIRIVEPVPSTARPARRKDFHRVSAAKTPSGFPVPRYVSLKSGKTNGRIGPSSNHRILWQYRRKGLPVIVVAETELWRKIRDFNGDEAWVFHGLLSGVRRAIVTDETEILRKPQTDARIMAVAPKNALLRLEGCENGWCAVTAEGGYKGYVSQNVLWGASPLY